MYGIRDEPTHLECHILEVEVGEGGHSQADMERGNSTSMSTMQLMSCNETLCFDVHPSAKGNFYVKRTEEETKKKAKVEQKRKRREKDKHKKRRCRKSRKEENLFFSLLLRNDAYMLTFCG